MIVDEMLVTDGTGRDTATLVEPDLVESSVDVAVIVAVPDADGVNRPRAETAPLVAAQLTVEL
jgi:hypothetical protein